MTSYIDLDGIQIPATGLVAPPEWGVAVNDNFNILRPDIGIARRAANQTIGTAADTEIILDTEDEDDAAYFDLIGNPTRLTFPVDGVYLIEASVSFDTDNTGYRLLKLNRNGGGSDVTDIRNGVDGNSTTVRFTHITPRTAGDYYEMVVHQNSGGDLDVVAKISVTILRNDG